MSCPNKFAFGANGEHERARDLVPPQTQRVLGARKRERKSSRTDCRNNAATAAFAAKAPSPSPPPPLSEDLLSRSRSFGGALILRVQVAPFGQMQVSPFPSKVDPGKMLAQRGRGLYKELV